MLLVAISAVLVANFLFLVANCAFLELRDAAGVVCCMALAGRRVLEAGDSATHASVSMGLCLNCADLHAN